MIRLIEVEPRPSGVMARTSGRGTGLREFALKLDALYAPDLYTWTVLDVGGGDAWFYEFYPWHKYYSLDPRTLSESEEKKECSIRGVSEFLPFHDASVDLLVSKQTLVHFTDPIQACAEMCRVSRRAIVIRQEFPESPIGWKGHSRVQIDSPIDILSVFDDLGWVSRYDGTDFIVSRGILNVL